MKCLYCHKEATQKHHIIFRSQGGTDSPWNLAPMCFLHHFEIHHGKNTKVRKEILELCYNQIKGHLDECWSGKIKPKIINILENNTC
jgi:hypothetical protein